MICVDLENGTFKENEEISEFSPAPYGKWLNNIHRLKSCPPLPEPTMDDVSFIESQARAGYASEDVSMIVESMSQEGIEPTWSMGDDTPVPVISSRPRLLYDYFKQRFAQVTNPAIDPLREGLVMSLETTLGAKGNLLEVSSDDAPAVSLSSPFLFDSDLTVIQNHPHLKTATIKARYTNGAGGLKAGLDKLCQECAEAVEKGSESVSPSLISPTRVRFSGDSVSLGCWCCSPSFDQDWFALQGVDRRGVCVDIFHAPLCLFDWLRCFGCVPVVGFGNCEKVESFHQG